MLNFFQSRPLVEQSSANWIFEAFEWALTYFDSSEFFNRSRLVQPTNEFFSGSVNSVHAKAENVFQHTLKHAGLSHWPFELLKPEDFQNIPAPQLEFDRVERNSGEGCLPELSNELSIYLSYNPQQTLKPEDLSSSFVHVMAQHLVIQSRELPPGGTDYFVEGTEILAIFLGFGVMLSNSAYTFRGGCGSCYNGQANRQATLSESEVIFALALYCRLKGIPNAEVTRFLKKYLKKSYKLALKQIEAQPDFLERLMRFR